MKCIALSNAMIFRTIISPALFFFVLLLLLLQYHITDGCSERGALERVREEEREREEGGGWVLLLSASINYTLENLIVHHPHALFTFTVH